MFWNVLELDEKVFQHEWHSYCISIDLKKKKVVAIHNGKVIARQFFEVAHNGSKTLEKLMFEGSFGDYGFTGAIADIQIFSRPVSIEDMADWTLCYKEVSINEYN